MKRKGKVQPLVKPERGRGGRDTPQRAGLGRFIRNVLGEGRGRAPTAVRMCFGNFFWAPDPWLGPPAGHAQWGRLGPRRTRGVVCSKVGHARASGGLQIPGCRARPPPPAFAARRIPGSLKYLERPALNRGLIVRLRVAGLCWVDGV
jgi:hypothetical protein